MDEKQQNSSLRRYNLINEQNSTNSNHSHEQQQQQQQQLIPITIERHKRRRSSITNEYTQLSSNNPDLISMTTNRKRSAQDDLVTYSAHQFFQEHEQYVRILFRRNKISLLFSRIINELDMNIRIVLN
jgi:hypothetical protein